MLVKHGNGICLGGVCLFRWHIQLTAALRYRSLGFMVLMAVCDVCKAGEKDGFYAKRYSVVN